MHNLIISDDTYTICVYNPLLYIHIYFYILIYIYMYVYIYMKVGYCK